TQTADNSVGGTTLENFVYDLDGNLIQDGTYIYSWDAENRLTGVRHVAPGAGLKSVSFEYDYLGRRVRKRVWDDTPPPHSVSPVQDRRFVYDGWLPVLELDGMQNNKVLRRFTWGLDLSGQNGNPSVAGIHGAGGIGGLVAIEDTTLRPVIGNPGGGD